MPLPLNTVIWSFHKTLQLMMIYLEDSSLIFSHNTGLWWCLSITSLIAKQKVLQFRRCLPGEHYLPFWYFIVTFTLNTASNLFTGNFGTMMIYQQTEEEPLAWIKPERHADRHGHSSGAVWESRWPSWAVRPNEPSGFRGRKAMLRHWSQLVHNMSTDIWGH